jgi:hypothetical protein
VQLNELEVKWKKPRAKWSKAEKDLKWQNAQEEDRSEEEVWEAKGQAKGY